MVLRFICGTGEPVICGIIIKSDQKTSEIPISWKTGIDITVDDVDDHNKVMAGVLLVLTWEKECPASMVHPLRLVLLLQCWPKCLNLLIGLCI
jgi:hypothetical protein